MKRFMRILMITGMSSVYLMQVPCTSEGGPILNTLGGNGLNLLPFTLPNFFATLNPFA